MNDIAFGTLRDVAPREAWRNEAVHFTPWLAQNLDRLGEAIGRNLELIAIESPLPSTDDGFSADILARDLADESSVLIENQLEKSDHGHLGQILTYLSGLKARTVVWVAPHFRDAHLSAVRWLNDNTKDDFAFFAVKLRVVRIGDSPLAPLFDVLARPNGFERQINSRKAAAESATENAHQEFWDAYLERFPDDRAVGFTPTRLRTQWLPAAGGLMVGIWLAQRSGVYVRGDRSVPVETVYAQLSPFTTELEAATGTTLRKGSDSWLLVLDSGIPFSDRSRWQETMDWLHRHARQHLRALETTLAASDLDTQVQLEPTSSL